VVAVGYDDAGQCQNVDTWAGIVQVAAGGNHTVGLVNDGTVVAVGWDYYHQCSDAMAWTDNITQVAAGGAQTVGLVDNHTVLAVGPDLYHQCSDAMAWTDNITQVAASGLHTVGLVNDGTVVAVGYDSDGQVSDVTSWADIVQVAAGGFHTVGLESDGTVVAVGDNYNGQCNVGGWNLKGPVVPGVQGNYSIKGSIKFYDWQCNKWIVVKSGTLHITYQYKHKIKGYWEPQPPIGDWPTLVPVDGYVGPFQLDAKGKIKNTPRLSLLLELGTYCTYPTNTYVTYIINGKVKVDKKTELVKSIKCTINGWGEFGDAFDDGGPSKGQFEGKFTATPIP
jgi:hypothetical protein